MNFPYSLPLTIDNPIPDDGELKSGLSIADVTPGLLGFLATLFLVLVVVFLIRDMVKRIRRVRYREQALTGVGSDVFIPSAEDGVDPAAGTVKSLPDTSADPATAADAGFGAPGADGPAKRG